MAGTSVAFPLAEGLGVFIGIVAWDLLAEGRMEIVKALIIAAPCSLLWYCARCWLEQSRRKKH